jgi:hypothetical protein
MNVATRRAISERLRQERETFDHQKKQDNWWFSLKLTMGFVSILLLPSILFVAATILFHHREYPDAVVVSAGIAIFADTLGLLIGIWKIVLSPGASTKLAPLTEKVPFEELQSV